MAGPPLPLRRWRGLLAGGMRGRVPAVLRVDWTQRISGGFPGGHADRVWLLGRPSFAQAALRATHRQVATFLGKRQSFLARHRLAPGSLRVDPGSAKKRTCSGHSDPRAAGASSARDVPAANDAGLGSRSPSTSSGNLPSGQRRAPRPSAAVYPARGSGGPEWPTFSYSAISTFCAEEEEKG
jgi:hypothetical protein